MSGQNKSSPLDLLRQAIEIAMPDLRHYLRPVRKAKVVGVYAAKGGKYYADVQPLRNDETVDPDSPVIPKVEIPVMWAGPKRGVVCPPAAGTYCDLTYYDGDPNYPRISNFRWYGMAAPEAELDELVIQQEPGVYIKIDRNHKIISVTSSDIEAKAGGNWRVEVGGDATIKIGGNADVTIGNEANVTCQKSDVTAEVSAVIRTPSCDLGGEGGTGLVTQECFCALTGYPHPEASKIVRAIKEKKEGL